jgi:hypothetical protein
MTASARQKPGRPLGLTLAILASVILFSFMPLIQVLFVLRLRQNLYFDPSGGAAGIEMTGIPDSTLFLQTAMGIGFFIIAVLAWRGRPSSIRFVMLAAVVLLTLISVVLTLIPLLSQPNLAQGLDSSEELSHTVLWGRLFLNVIIPLYVVWYTNRGPARAFYRGYYLPDPANTDPSSATTSQSSG